MTSATVTGIIAQIARLAAALGRPVRLMEVCGTHTVAIFRHGIRSLLPETIRLLSGPGCPVCVTAVEDVEAAILLSKSGAAILTTFGDMMRVPGRRESLSEARAEGADVRIIYSPLDALEIAAHAPGREVVFFATGFETTSPLVAATVAEAERREIENFSIFSVHKLVPPALRALLGSGEIQVDGFILPGHVCAVTGVRPFAFLPEQFGKAAVISGFEAADILQAIAMLLAQIASGTPRIEVQYSRIVHEEGNPKALAVLDHYFEADTASWRGIGAIPESGLRLRRLWSHRDVVHKLGITRPRVPDPPGCRCGEVLKGLKTPPDCALFGKSCTPERPVGACMVSTEGSCAAYYKYQGTP